MKRKLIASFLFDFREDNIEIHISKFGEYFKFATKKQIDNWIIYGEQF